MAKKKENNPREGSHEMLATKKSFHSKIEFSFPFLFGIRVLGYLMKNAENALNKICH